MTVKERFDSIIAENNGIITAGKMMLLIEELAEKRIYDEIPYGVGLLMNFQDGKDVQRAYDKIVDRAITNKDFDIAEKYNVMITDDESREWWTEIIEEKKSE